MKYSAERENEGIVAYCAISAALCWLNKKFSKGMISANWNTLKKTAISVKIKNGTTKYLNGLANLRSRLYVFIFVSVELSEESGNYKDS